MNELSDNYLFWLEATVYDRRWQLDVDLLDYLLGCGQ